MNSTRLKKIVEFIRLYNKKTMKQTIIFILFIFSSFYGKAQKPCQAHFSEMMLEEFDDFVKYYYLEGGKAKKTAPVLKYVPITIHLVANDDGSRRVDTYKALNLVCALNETFNQADIYFFLDDLKFINNTDWNTNESGVQSLMPNQTKVNNTMNVYFLGNTSANDICGVYYGNAVANGNGGSTDIVVMTSGCAVASIFSHEAGHFLSLPHTFNGWEERGIDGNTGQAPNWAEKVSGANCTTAGDKLCDTSPDYLYTRWDRTDCEASGIYNFELEGENVSIELTDPDSIPFTVDGMNIMSYASNSCRDSFSIDQVAAMHYNLENHRASYIRYGETMMTLNDDVDLNYPLTEDITAFDQVTFEWESVPNATHYLVQVNYAASFSTSVAIDEKIVTNNSATFFNLPPERTLYWRVIPYNGSYTCHSGTKTPFKTGLFTANLSDVGIENIQAFYLNPNPYTLARSINVYILATEETGAEIFIHNINGQLLDHQAIQLSLGQNYITVPNKEWMHGMYLVTLKTPNGQVTKKLII